MISLNERALCPAPTSARANFIFTLFYITRYQTMELFLDVLSETLVDTAKMLPFLF